MGRNASPSTPTREEIKRFNLAERGIHLFRLVSFVILGITGLILAFNLNLWQHLLFGSARNLHNFHVWAGIVFIATTLGGILLWFRDAFFESYDKDWVRKMGGYLGHKGEVPAGRFNAGQKMFYWYSGILGALMSITGLVLIFKGAFSLPTICVTSTIHNLSGLLPDCRRAGARLPRDDRQPGHLEGAHRRLGDPRVGRAPPPKLVPGAALGREAQSASRDEEGPLGDADPKAGDSA